ncbi:MAG TPA: hypothetical protein ENI61_00095 [Ignavibacteria bacterium]|nr:hypothetical protein [Ignavibacteria bacterium]
MHIKKVNIGLSLSRNFDKVTLDMIDEPIEYEEEQEFIDGIKKRFKLIRKLVEEEYKEIQK